MPVSNGVILSKAAFQAERRTSRGAVSAAREIPRPAGKGAGLRDDAIERRLRMSRGDGRGTGERFDVADNSAQGLVEILVAISAQNGPLGAFGKGPEQRIGLGLADHQTELGIERSSGKALTGLIGRAESGRTHELDFKEQICILRSCGELIPAPGFDCGIKLIVGAIGRSAELGVVEPRLLTTGVGDENFLRGKNLGWDGSGRNFRLDGFEDWGLCERDQQKCGNDGWFAMSGS